MITNNITITQKPVNGTIRFLPDEYQMTKMYVYKNRYDSTKFASASFKHKESRFNYKPFLKRVPGKNVKSTWNEIVSDFIEKDLWAARQAYVLNDRECVLKCQKWIS